MMFWKICKNICWEQFVRDQSMQQVQSNYASQATNVFTFRQKLQELYPQFFLELITTQLRFYICTWCHRNYPYLETKVLRIQNVCDFSHLFLSQQSLGFHLVWVH